jgi:hypothetical protein
MDIANDGCLPHRGHSETDFLNRLVSECASIASMPRDAEKSLQLIAARRHRQEHSAKTSIMYNRQRFHGTYVHENDIIQTSNRIPGYNGGRHITKCDDNSLSI